MKIFSLLEKIITVVFIVLIGTNFAEYFSKTSPVLGYTIIGGLIACILNIIFTKNKKNIFILFTSIDVQLWIGFYMMHFIYLMYYDNLYQATTSKTILFIIVCFFVGIYLMHSMNTRSYISNAALYVVIICCILNCYEFFIENNTWSTAPGRSAGLHVNPNLSAANIVAYSIVFLSLSSNIKIFNGLIFFLMAFLGVVTTFSRTGIILMLLPVIVYCIKNISRGISIATVLKTFILLVVFIFCAVYFAVFIIDNFDLSSDALMRVDSLLYGNLSESYSEARGDLASYMLDVYMQSPVFGNGVGYASIFPEGTHNMFLYIAIDMGIIGLLYYILLIARVVTMRMRQLLMLNVNGIMSIALICWLVLYGFASHNIIYDMPLLLPLSFIVLGPRNYA